ncbi:MAG TPA: B12-binding domain-containing radical SAM protein [Myxococcota bacterium]|nr:B12-binding domain-containing radical SAM protein [Myxococcota bacterium]HRY97101.1 B12-binding domain-containing radical SAM protein [Myxococcota bacterium]HSA23156.1 B12-binding domain-containing radical SAM protein [Myxococcota bacterium]
MGLRVVLAQLPFDPPAALAPASGAPLGVACLALAARQAQARGELPGGTEVELAAGTEVESLGDTALAERLAKDEPELLGLGLYAWNVERSLHLAHEVKRRSPGTRILVGGPEVAVDNAWLWADGVFDLAVFGEGEQAFLELLASFELSASVPGLAVVRPGEAPVRPRPGPAPALPGSPYLAGLVPLSPGGHAALETVRGCRRRCAYCHYARGRRGLRRLTAAEALDTVRRLLSAGARDLAWVDPNLDDRPDLPALLAGLAALPRPDGLRMFGEVQPDRLDEAALDGLARAGFTRLELGLQSASPQTLARVGRGGAPADAVRAALGLRARGVEPVVDLIAGLPGDGLAEVRRGLDLLARSGLGGNLQFFPLSLLPGTRLRRQARQLGLVHEPRPPYRILRSPWLSEEQLARLQAEAEELAGAALDEPPRPHLCGPQGDAAGPPDRFELDVREPEGAWRERLGRPGARHAALWCRGADLWAGREALCAALDLRLAVDPYAVLDVVLAPERVFPLDLVERLRHVLETGPGCYLSRCRRPPTGDALRRVAVVFPAGLALAPDYLAALGDLAPVFQEIALEAALARAEELGDAQPGAWIPGLAEGVDGPAFAALAARADPAAVAFADRELERRWLRLVLGYA